MTQTAKDAAKFLKSTLRLPASTFPPRAQPADLAKYLKRCSDDLYTWQRQHRPVTDTFILHDGPPYANGDLHVGHALNKILKDIICRTALANGKRVDYVPGWDCHGLPIELKALEQHGWHRGQDVDPAAIRKAARKFAFDAVKKQMKGFKSWAVMADWENHWKTMDKSFEIRQLEVFQKMAQHGLIYRRHKPVFWSPSSGTALAEAELEYKDDHVSTAAYVKFPLSGLESTEGPVSALIWTTTPWTLPANQAIAIHSDLEYVLVTSPRYGRLVIARSRLAALSEILNETLETIRLVSGAELLKCSYNGLQQFRPSSLDRPIVHADFVSADSGTGLVHCAPGHGMEDYAALSKLIESGRVSVRAPVDDRGRFDASATPGNPSVLEGLEIFKEGNSAVLKMLDQSGVLVHSASYKHKYPIDWRTKEPIIIRATAQWFADVSSIRGATLQALDRVDFTPPSGKSRLRSFVENRSEWCISRQRSWGVPIPALYHRKSGEALMSPESVQHIIATIETRGIDAWWTDPPNEPVWVLPGLDSEEYERGTDTMDVWFDSGSSWTFMDAATTQSKPLADVYLEGSDQHRGWFQSSLLTHVAFQKSSGKDHVFAPFQALLTHGFTLDGQGKKMSKSLGNVVSPDQIIAGLEPATQTQQVTSKKRQMHSLGPDALRLWVASTDFTKDVVISEAVVKAVHTALAKYRVTFKVLLGMLQDFDPKSATPYGELSMLDQVALLQLSETAQSVRTAYAEHAFHRGILTLNRWLVTDLSGFYLEAIKDIIYCEGASSVRRHSALSTLYHVFSGLQDMLAPALPSLVEESWEHSSNALKSQEHPLRRTQRAPPKEWQNGQLRSLLPVIKAVNNSVKAAQEDARGEKVLGQSLASNVALLVHGGGLGKAIASIPTETWEEMLVVSRVQIREDGLTEALEALESRWVKTKDVVVVDSDMEGRGEAEVGEVGVAIVTNPTQEKCARCWRFKAPPALNEEMGPSLCKRCEDVVQEYPR
jgi:isoleucyl-tRNA synthetase